MPKFDNSVCDVSNALSGFLHFNNLCQVNQIEKCLNRKLDFVITNFVKTNTT